MRNIYNEQLEELQEEMKNIGALCEEAIATAACALLQNDTELAKKISPIEKAIDEKENEIEGLCMRMILKQQPVATDLRRISAALKMITDMERIGDQSEDIAELIKYLDNKNSDEADLIAQMSHAVIKMVNESIEAYVKGDENLSLSVMLYDDVVDSLFSKIKESLITLIAEHPEEGEYALDLLMIAKYFERIGDHATNIAEWVVFSVTGKRIKEE